MTCEHCARAVEREVGQVPGVDGVTVDLAGGRATVSVTSPVGLADLRAAVDEAGYTLVP